MDTFHFGEQLRIKLEEVSLPEDISSLPWQDLIELTNTTAEETSTVFSTLTVEQAMVLEPQLKDFLAESRMGLYHLDLAVLIESIRVGQLFIENEVDTKTNHGPDHNVQDAGAELLTPQYRQFLRKTFDETRSRMEKIRVSLIALKEELTN